MTIRQQFYVILRAGLWEHEAILPDLYSVDYNGIIELAREQSVLGLIASGLERVNKGFIKSSTTEGEASFKEELAEMEKWNKMMSFSIGVFVEKMREAGITTVLVKGQGIAQCYEQPLRRAAGDIDFFFNAENYEKAKEFMIPLATKVGRENVGNKHFDLSIDPWNIELHGTLHGGLTCRVDKELDRIQEDTFNGNVRVWIENGVEILLPCEDNDVMFVFSHILQHFFKGGIGLRQVCDWCRLLWTYKETIDRSLLESRLRRMGLMCEWKAFAYFAVNYLGMPISAMPLYEGNQRWKRKAVWINSFILEVGNFGKSRNNSFYQKYPYLVYKVISFSRHCWDFCRHLFIFPYMSIAVFPRIVFVGFRAVAHGR